MKTITFALLAASLLACAACAPKNNQLYIMNGYSEALYAERKNPCDATVLNHQQVLEKIIADSQAKNMRVAPGIYAEYGYILLRTNRSSEAVTYLNQEAVIYPESKPFMDRLIQFATTRGKAGDATVDKGVLSAEKKEETKPNE